jgi:hypothetical protein
LQRQADPAKVDRARIRIRRVNINLRTSILPLEDKNLHADTSKLSKSRLYQGTEEIKKTPTMCYLIRIVFQTNIYKKVTKINNEITINI